MNVYIRMCIVFDHMHINTCICILANIEPTKLEMFLLLYLMLFYFLLLYLLLLYLILLYLMLLYLMLLYFFGYYIFCYYVLICLNSEYDICCLFTSLFVYVQLLDDDSCEVCFVVISYRSHSSVLLT